MYKVDYSVHHIDTLIVADIYVRYQHRLSFVGPQSFGRGHAAQLSDMLMDECKQYVA